MPHSLLTKQNSQPLMEEPDALRVGQLDESTEFERRINAAILQATCSKNEIMQIASQLGRLQQKVQDATEKVDDNIRELQALKQKCVGPHLDKTVNNATEEIEGTGTLTDPEVCTSEPSESTDTVSDSESNRPPAEEGECRSVQDFSSCYVSQPSESPSGSMEYEGEKLLLETRDQRPHDQPIQKVYYRKQTLPKSLSMTSMLAKGKKPDKKVEGLQVKLITNYGSPNTKQFLYPYQLANGPNNELFVTDRENHQLIIFDDKLEYLSVFGSKGPGGLGKGKRGTFYNPTGLAVDLTGGYLFVADHNNIIQKFKITQDDRSYKLEYITHYGEKGRENGQLHCPCGLAFCSKGLFVCDFRNHRIQVFTGSKIYTFGQHGSENGEFKEPHSIVINKDEDKLFVTDHSNNRIQVFTPEGGFIGIIVDKTNAPSQPQVQYPRGIFYAPDGHLLVSCTYTHCIVEFTEDGEYISTIEGIIQPGGIVLRHTGEVVITSNVKQVLYVIAAMK